MRISDWSSDVFSSDLSRAKASGSMNSITPLSYRMSVSPGCFRHASYRCHAFAHSGGSPSPTRQTSTGSPARRRYCWVIVQAPLRGGVAPHWPRSEEHTSELQSLMRLSYAVFCLKKKIITSLHTQQ